MRFSTDAYAAINRMRPLVDFCLFVRELDARRAQLLGQIELCNDPAELRLLQGRARETRELIQVLKGEETNHHATA